MESIRKSQILNVGLARVILRICGLAKAGVEWSRSCSFYILLSWVKFAMELSMENPYCENCCGKEYTPTALLVLF